MNELLEKINQTIDDSINTSNAEVGLQLKILKNLKIRNLKELIIP
mgnify:CR=1 FL=1